MHHLATIHNVTDDRQMDAIQYQKCNR